MGLLLGHILPWLPEFWRAGPAPMAVSWENSAQAPLPRTSCPCSLEPAQLPLSLCLLKFKAVREVGLGAKSL